MAPNTGANLHGDAIQHQCEQLGAMALKMHSKVEIFLDTELPQPS